MKVRYYTIVVGGAIRVRESFACAAAGRARKSEPTYLFLCDV